MQRSSFVCGIAGILAGSLVSCPAYAYLDPGTGSILLQGLLAAIAAGAVAIHNYWHRIKRFFSSKKDVESDAKSEPDQ